MCVLVRANDPLKSCGAPHFTASEISADTITAPISPHRNSPPAKFTAFALHRRQITAPCKSPPRRILRRRNLRLATLRRSQVCENSAVRSDVRWFNILSCVLSYLLQDAMHIANCSVFSVYVRSSYSSLVFVTY